MRHTFHLLIIDPQNDFCDLPPAYLAGAIPLFPLADQFWGDRYGQIRDPFGHSWSIGSPIKG